MASMLKEVFFSAAWVSPHREYCPKVEDNICYLIFIQLLSFLISSFYSVRFCIKFCLGLLYHRSWPLVVSGTGNWIYQITTELYCTSKITTVHCIFVFSFQQSGFQTLQNLSCTVYGLLKRPRLFTFFTELLWSLTLLPYLSIFYYVQRDSVSGIYDHEVENNNLLINTPWSCQECNKTNVCSPFP